MIWTQGTGRGRKRNGEAPQKFSNKIRHTERSSRWQHRSFDMDKNKKKEKGKEMCAKLGK